jgi:hypothetical protein
LILLQGPLLLRRRRRRDFTTLSSTSRLINIHRRGRSRFFLFLDLLDVSVLKCHNAVQVQPGLHFYQRGVTFGIWGNVGDGSGSKDGVDARKGRGIGVRSLERKFLATVEGEDLGGWDGVALWEDEDFSVIIWVSGYRCPLDFDGVVVDVVDCKITNTENGRKHSTCESGTTGDGFVLVQRERERFATESVLDTSSQSWDTCASTNEFDRIDLVEGETRFGDGTMDGCFDRCEEGDDKAFELLAVEFG